MSKIIPFSALLPRPGLEAKIASPPYDVLTSEEARALAEGNPHSFLHVTKAEIDLPPDVPEGDERIYERARENYRNFKREGWLVPTGRASFYVYRLVSFGFAQTGLVCGASVDEYDCGLIKRHERTRPPKEDDRTRFAAAIGAHAEPVILAFRAEERIRRLLAAEVRGAPLCDVTDRGGVRHLLWRVAAEDEARGAFEDVTALYIADGHHRSAAASRVRAMIGGGKQRQGEGPRDFFPAVLFPHDEVRVYRYDWEGPEAERPLADVTIADIMTLADRGGIMPPKSTWFAPKLASGLFVYEL